MFEPDTAKGRRTVYVMLWTLAATCLGLAVTETAVFGLDRVTLIMLATVFVAVTEEYRGQRRCSADSGA